MQNKSKNFLVINDILRIFLKRKWAFIATVVIFLIIGILYIFLKTPLYESVSKLQVQNIYYNDDLLKYFPEEAKKLGIYPTNSPVDELSRNILNSYTNQLKDQAFLNKVANEFDNNLTIEDIAKSLILLTDYSNKTILVKVLYKNSEIAYKINANLINTFVNNKNLDTLNTIEQLISKINIEQERIHNELNSFESESLIESGKVIYNDMESIKYSLTANRDFLINKLQIIQAPEIQNKAINVSYLKEILVTLFLSIAAGIIIIFLPSVFLPLKDGDERNQ